MTFHYLLMAGHAIYLKQLMAELYHTGLTPGQPKVLDYLMEHDGANQKEIANACHIEAATLTSVLNGMEAKSLIERRRTDGNRRSFYIFLTDRGREMGREVTEAFARLEEYRISLLKRLVNLWKCSRNYIKEWKITLIPGNQQSKHYI